MFKLDLMPPPPCSTFPVQVVPLLLIGTKDIKFSLLQVKNRYSVSGLGQPAVTVCFPRQSVKTVYKISHVYMLVQSD